MKRIAILFVALWVAAVAAAGQTTAGAQNGGAEVFQGVSRKLSALGDYRIDFQVEMPGAEQPSKGYCIVAGERYLIDVDGMAQACDGKAVAMVNHLTKEVTLDNPKPTSRSLFDNPTKAFDFDADLFTIDRVAPEAAVVHLWLTPAEGVLEGVEQVHLVVDSLTQLPASLSYDFAGAELTIKIIKIEAVVASEGHFTFAHPEGYEVIDFR